MSFDQTIKNTLVFFYQFVLPFSTKTEDLEYIKAKLKQLEKIRPGNNKSKQNNFKKIFNTRKELTTPLLLQFFDIRNDETRQKVMEKCSKKQLGMIETSTLINAEQE